LQAGFGFASTEVKNGTVETMNWFPYLLTTLVFVLVLLLKRAGQISAQQAHELLRNGAIVLDVRSAGEYVAGHIQGVANMPLAEIETQISRRVEARDQVVLLHCQSGTRSAMAVKKLKAMGYLHVFNLGSYVRAVGILGSK